MKEVLRFRVAAHVVCLLYMATTIAAQAQTFTSLLTFDGTNGAPPVGAFAQATNGNLYGSTGSGGAKGNYGTIFKITPSGALTTLHSFDNTDGYAPEAELVQASDGSFYGTTVLGGASGWG